MRIGLVIQGPAVSYGQLIGPNQAPKGFDARETIFENIRNFSSRVQKIVISTWKDSGLDLSGYPGVMLIENEPPAESDFDNRRKQFISTYAGVKWLTGHTDVTHIIKIRTDHLVNAELADWLDIFYNENTTYFRAGLSNQKNFLIFSEFIKDSFLFYTGDFIFAGTSHDMESFCKSNLMFGKRLLHPLINADFVLKYLSVTDPGFREIFFSGIPLLWQTAGHSNARVSGYWSDVKYHRFSFIPRQLFAEIVWRGRKMNEVIPAYQSSFGFYEDWLQKLQAPIESSGHLPTKSWLSLIPDQQSFKEIRYVYLQHVKKRITWYLKKAGIKK